MAENSKTKLLSEEEQHEQIRIVYLLMRAWDGKATRRQLEESIVYYLHLKKAKRGHVPGMDILLGILHAHNIADVSLSIPQIITLKNRLLGFSDKFIKPSDWANASKAVEMTKEQKRKWHDRNE